MQAAQKVWDCLFQAAHMGWAPPVAWLVSASFRYHRNFEPFLGSSDCLKVSCSSLYSLHMLGDTGALIIWSDSGPSWNLWVFYFLTLKDGMILHAIRDRIFYLRGICHTTVSYELSCYYLICLVFRDTTKLLDSHHNLTILLCLTNLRIRLSWHI